MKAVICPVCNGKGTIPLRDTYVTGLEVECHGCKGMGWVTVPEYESYTPYIPYKVPDTTAK